MIRAGVLAGDDAFHRAVRRSAPEAGLRVERAMRSVRELGDCRGLEVLIVHDPSTEVLDLIRDAVGTLPIVLAGPHWVHPEELAEQDGGAVVSDTDAAVIVAAARAAAMGLTVTLVHEPGGEIGADSDSEDQSPLLQEPADSTVAVGARPGVDGEALTPREIDVLRLAGSGRTNQEISLQLGISLNTVKYHLAGLYAKLGGSRRSELVFAAIRRGLVAL